MPELQFNYGVMNAAKSLLLLVAAFSFEERGNRVLCLNPEVASRDGGVILSRTGLKRTALIVGHNDNLMDVAASSHPDCILVDEAQFLLPQQVVQLANVVDDLGIQVQCYGLLKDFANDLFPGSEALLKLADRLNHIVTLCESPGCENIASMNLRVENGKPTYVGAQVAVDSHYRSVCRQHYFYPELEQHQGLRP